MNVIVTGASKGVGYYAALHLANTGHRVFALSRNESGLEKLKLNSESKLIVTFPCDLSNESSVQEVIKKINEHTSGIDALINNAGYLVNKPFDSLSLKDWKEIFDVNVFGVFNVTKGLLPLLRSGKISNAKKIKSHVVNISSMGGVQGSQKFPGLSAYSTSKGALLILTECLSEEFKAEGIFVNTISLGSVETEMFSKAFPGMKAAATPEEVGKWIAEFSMNGFNFFNGKNIQLSTATP